MSPEGQLPAQAIIDAVGDVRSREVLISNAQLLALFATPISLVPAPGAGYALILEDAQVYHAAGTGATQDRVLKITYTDGSGTDLGAVTTGFLNQATAQHRLIKSYRATSTPSDINPTANAALVISAVTGEVTVADFTLKVRIRYRVVATAW